MEQKQIIARMAHMYYKQNMDLKEIAKAFNTSYATVSRFLKKGRELGIINIQMQKSLNIILFKFFDAGFNELYIS